MGDPVLHYDLSLDRPDGVWQRVGDYDIWRAARPLHVPELRLLVLLDGGVTSGVRQGTGMRLIPAGRPHHIEGLFGYWCRSDADRVWIRTVQGESRLYVLVCGGLSGTRKRDEILWICPRCARPLYQRSCDEPLGAPGFWAAQQAAIDGFNADPVLRTCGGCGNVHPPAYPFGGTGDPRW
jgi:hypothetical protein